MGIRRSRAQAAVEFLITNGWAILTVIILLAALFYIGVLSPQQKQPNTCAFSPGLTCYSFKVGSENGTLELDFGQALGKSIQVTGISCSPNESASFTSITPVHIPSGEHRWIAGQDSNNTNITCEGATGEPGARYSGRVCVSYEELDTRTTRIACCDMRVQLEPASTPRPTPTPIPTPKTILACDPNTPWPSGSLIDTPGNYALTGSLTETSGGDCIRITSDNVTLNCGSGNTITSTSGGGGGNGIILNTVSGVTVQNCVVSGFNRGIYLSAANNNTLTGNSITGSGDFGIRLSTSNNNILTGNNVSSNSNGIALYISAGNILVGNTANSDYNGLSLEYASGNNITGNNFDLNEHGIFLVQNDDNNIFTSNTANSNTWDGIRIQVSSDSNNFTGNTANSNYYGIGLSSSRSNNFMGNTAMGNSKDFYCGDASSNNDLGNTCNTQSGCSPAEGGWLSTCPPPPPPCPSSITTCCDINSPGAYMVAENITASDTCIRIFGGGNGSTLDCQGNNITGPGSAGYGIYLKSVSLVTVNNCTVSGFEYGVYVTSPGNSNILTANTANSNSQNGIYLNGATRNNLAGNTANSNYNGITVGWSSNDNNLTGNNASQNRGTGIALWSSHRNNLTGNNASSNPGAGIALDYSSKNNNLTGNTANLNTWDGIAVGGSSNDNKFTGNNASSNAHYGIVLASSSNNNFTGNTAMGNMKGFYCYSTNSNIDSGNTCDSRVGCTWLTTCPPSP